MQNLLNRSNQAIEEVDQKLTLIRENYFTLNGGVTLCFIDGILLSYAFDTGVTSIDWFRGEGLVILIQSVLINGLLLLHFRLKNLQRALRFLVALVSGYLLCSQSVGLYIWVSTQETPEYLPLVPGNATGMILISVFVFITMFWCYRSEPKSFVSPHLSAEEEF